MRLHRPRGLQQQFGHSEAHHDLQPPFVVDHHDVDDHCDVDDDDAPTTTSTGAASPACTHITAAAVQGQGAAGTITGMITVTNVGTSPCTVDGYPAMALFSGSGTPLTVTLVNGLSVSVSTPANAPPSSFAVAPSSTAQFAYQFSDVPVGSETSCPTSESASVTMPGATTASPAFQLAIGPCGDGTIRVSPVYTVT